MYPSEIELLVDEAAPGHFYWLLQKPSDGAARPVVVAYATGPMPTRGAAMMEGIEALQRRADERRHVSRPAMSSTRGGPCTHVQAAAPVWH